MIHGGGGNFYVWFQVMDYSHYCLEIVATWTHPITWRAERGAYIIMSEGCQVIYGENTKNLFSERAIGPALAYISWLQVSG
jgi:hypothetical protein